MTNLSMSHSSRMMRSQKVRYLDLLTLSNQPIRGICTIRSLQLPRLYSQLALKRRVSLRAHPTVVLILSLYHNLTTSKRKMKTVRIRIGFNLSHQGYFTTQVGTCLWLQISVMPYVTIKSSTIDSILRWRSLRPRNTMQLL